MQAGVGLLVSDVMPIYMIIPRYSHNYAQFCQLLNSNLFTHRKYLCSREKPLVKPMAPGSIFLHINVSTLSYFYCFYFTLHLYHKNTKNNILSYLTFVSDREGIDNPFIALVARILFVCVGARDSCVASYWIDTLVLKNWGKYLRYFGASPFPLQGKTNASSRGSKKDFWRRCRGGLRKVKSRFELPTTSHFWRHCRGVYAKVNIPSTHHIPLSPALHYFPFASRFPLPQFTLAILFALSLSLSSISFSICLFCPLSFCLFVC